MRLLFLVPYKSEWLHGATDWERIDQVYISDDYRSPETSIGFVIFCLDLVKKIRHIGKLPALQK
jgi:hypothetical protein